MSRRNRLGFAIAGISGLTVLAAVFGWYSLMGLARDHAVRSMGAPRGAANAILHAYAGAETYALLRRIGLGKVRSSSITIQLGYCNEWMEFLTTRMDSVREMEKDLYNNLYGLSVARWLEERAERPGWKDRLRVVSELAAQRHLPWRPGDIGSDLPLQPRNPSIAIARHEASAGEIVRTAALAFAQVERSASPAARSRANDNKVDQHGLPNIGGER